MKILKPEYHHQDPRRELFQLLTADIKQINLYNIPRGSILGNHYHLITTEYFYVVKGTLLYNNDLVINKNVLFEVSPKESHSIESMTDVTLMTFLTHKFDQSNQDIYKK